MSKSINLYDLISIENYELRVDYIRLIAGFNDEKQIKIKELDCLKSLIITLGLDRNMLEGFLYSYEIPQLGKEFDLIKIFENSILNIELKTEIKSESDILKQLMKNLQYFGIFQGVKNLFCFVQKTNKLYKLLNNQVVSIEIDELREVISNYKDAPHIDADSMFSPNKFLVSPLNTPEKFLNHEYFLTEQQLNIKKKIISDFSEDNKFFGLTGTPGTGKTLLLYDIALDLSREYKVGIVHCGLLNQGHDFLNKNFNNIDIVEAKELRYREIKDWDVVLVDETHRIYPTQFEKITNWIIKTKAFSVLSFDETQILSISENKFNISNRIRELCGQNGLFTLSKKIRSNKELASFIKSLFNTSKKNLNISYDNVHIYYSNTVEGAVDIKNFLVREKEYRYIAYTPSSINYTDPRVHDKFNNSHRVIGQEFDNVVMLMGNMFFYDKNLLKSIIHKNPDYLYDKLLYQGITRTRNKLAIIIYNNENLFRNILAILKNEEKQK